MRHRQLPERWYFTDRRSGDALWAALGRLPPGSGVVFRHHDLPPGERKALLLRVRAVARRRRLVLVIAGAAYGLRGDGVHLGRRGRAPAGRLATASAHDPAELVRAHRAGAALVFVSPVYPTRSHPGSAVLGPGGFGRLARGSRRPVAALGGMTAARFARLKPWGAVAWGAIDAWTGPGNDAR